MEKAWGVYDDWFPLRGGGGRLRGSPVQEYPGLQCPHLTATKGSEHRNHHKTLAEGELANKTRPWELRKNKKINTGAFQQAQKELAPVWACTKAVIGAEGANIMEIWQAETRGSRI